MTGRVVVSISGLQAVGKTTVAHELARRLRAVAVSRDPLMKTLMAAGVPVEPTATLPRGVGGLGYDLQTSLLRELLAQGLSVVLECLAGPDVRAVWRSIAAEFDARFVMIDLVCADAGEHRRRFEQRGDIELGSRTIDWGTVEEYRRRYAAHPDADVIESGGELGAVVERIVERIG